jgi:hypothetical protein
VVMITDRKLGVDRHYKTDRIVERQTTGLHPTFALGATLIAPQDLVKSLEVLSLATLTSGLPHPEVTSSFSGSFLIRGCSYTVPPPWSLP